MRRLAVVALLFAAPAFGQKDKDPAQALVVRIQKFYESTKDLHAKFEQELDSGLGRKRTASGDLWLKKPGKMRWEYAKPEKKLMIADGQVLWVYEPEDQQAFKQSLQASSLPSSVTFLWGEGKLSDEFQVSQENGEATAGLGGAGEVVLKLVPRKPTAQYRYLLFVVDEKSAMVKESLLYDQQGGTNHMKFRDVEINKGAADEKFKFTPPSGTRILRP
jgi:outer membrane lipoprotein carrier protein